MSKDYTVRLRDGALINITDVYRVEKDGAGLRFYDEDGSVIAGFDDGSTSAHYVAGSQEEEDEA